MLFLQAINQVHMKQMLITVSCLLAMGVAANAQKCRTSEKVAQSKAMYPEVAKRMAEIEAFTKDYVANNRSENKTTQKHLVPVVVHVLYKNSTQNVTDAQITSEFAVLNEAYSNTNASGANTPAPFKAMAGNAELEFCITQVAPDGTATTGIERKQVPSSFDGEKDYFNPGNGGIAPWDPQKYLNVYLVELTAGNLGFTYTPGAAPAGEEGVVIDYRAWGTVGEAANNQPNHLGKTAVHEFGHYFNLEHIWGPNGGCSDDDGVTDTPPQDQESGGCPTFPTFDNCTTSGDGIMFMNYMDYVDDNCMTLFTQGQVQRMQAAVAGPRASLTSSTMCFKLSVNNVPDADFVITPNPANDWITIKLQRNVDFHVDVVNSMGSVVIKANAERLASLSVAHLPAGVYSVKVTCDNKTTTEKIIITH